MADFILLDEDFSDFPIGEFPYDKNHSAMGEYHFIHFRNNIIFIHLTAQNKKYKFMKIRMYER